MDGGIRNKQEPREIFEVVQEEVRPCLIVEVISPKYEEVRRNDYVKKKDIYERVGIPEYLIVEPYQIPGSPIRQWTGYRLGFDGRWEAAEERAAREAEARKVEAEARKAAEERATREAEARKAAEAEIACLRAELERR